MSSSLSAAETLGPAVQGWLDRFVAEGVQRGLQAAVYLDGKLVVDAFAGPAVTAGTLFPVYSVTKGIAATLAHLVVERGLIEYDTPIAKVWPEFGARGKRGITLRHALTHTAGLSNLPPDLDRAQLCDWDAMCALLTATEPDSAPGAVRAYHAITYSWLVGEVVRRVDGRPFPQMLREEIGRPLGVADDLFCGLPDTEMDRVALLTSDLPVDPPAAGPQSIPPPIHPLVEWMNSPDARAACLPGCSGVMNARALARHYAALLPGGIDGVELLPPARVRLATQPQVSDEMPLPTQGLGYNLGTFSPGDFGHNGFGGATGFADPAHRLAFGFTRGHFGPHDPLAPIYAELRRGLKMD